MKVRALIVAVLTLGSFNMLAQTNGSQASPVGTWRIDLAKSTFGSDPAPKTMTLTILKYTPTLTSWRVDEVGSKGEATSYSWSGPLNGSLQPLRNSKGQILAEESLTQDEKGALHRHVVDSSDGSSFDARATLSPDANTITDVVTAKTKDGKVFEMTMVWRRSGAGEVGVVPPSARIAAQAGEITKTLQQRYSDWMNAFRRGDGATMDKMEADGLVLVFQDGEIWSKERSRVEELKGRGPLPVTHTLEEVRVRTNGDVAIVTGVQNDVSTKDGGKSRTAFTSVWKREAGDWKVWSAHWSDATQKK